MIKLNDRNKTRMGGKVKNYSKQVSQSCAPCGQGAYLGGGMYATPVGGATTVKHYYLNIVEENGYVLNYSYEGEPELDADMARLDKIYLTEEA